MSRLNFIKRTSRLEVVAVGVLLPRENPASMDLVLRDVCWSFESETEWLVTGPRWGGTLGLYSIVRLLWLFGFETIMALWPMSELSSSASSTGEGGNGGNSRTSTLT